MAFQLFIEHRLHAAAADLRSFDLPGGGELKPVGAFDDLTFVRACGGTYRYGRHPPRPAVIELRGRIRALFVIAGLRLQELINEILDLSKIESGMMEFNYAPVSLYILCEDVKNTYSFRCIHIHYRFLLHRDRKGAILQKFR